MCDTGDPNHTWEDIAGEFENQRNQARADHTINLVPGECVIPLTWLSARGHRMAPEEAVAALRRSDWAYDAIDAYFAENPGEDPNDPNTCKHLGRAVRDAALRHLEVSMTDARPTPREAIRDLLLTVAHELRIERAVEWLNDRLTRRPR